MTFAVSKEITSFGLATFGIPQIQMIEVYKFIHGIYATGHNLLPRALKSALRGHEYKLKKRHRHSQVRANFFPSELLIYGTDFHVM